MKYFPIVYLLVEILSFFAFRFLFQDRNMDFKQQFWTAYWIWTSFCLLITIGLVFFKDRFADPSFMNTAFVLLSLVLANFLSKGIFVVFYLGNQLFNTIMSWFTSSQEVDQSSRRDFITKVGLGVGSVVFGGLLYGVIRGRYQFKIHRQKLALHNLPDSFVGKTIIQLSDMHLGSFPKGSNQLEKAVQMVNELDPDYIFFTGDMVNERAIEAEDWIDTLSKLQAKYGKYSSLGNHDYGDYYAPWNGQPEKIEENVLHLKTIQEKMGFQLLRNENILLQQGQDTIRLIGLENWGTKRFSKYGDLKKAMEGVKDEEVQILLSHDPTHWDAKVLGKTAIDVSLAGHTHGSQMGIEIPGLRWSPAEYIYKQWAGHYQQGKQQLYVNRGLGYIGYAGRIGIWPEITYFTLEKA